MRSRPVTLPARRRHEAFLRSPRFAPELARIPFKWRKRVVSQALEKMAWSSWWKVYESIAVDYVRDFASQYVPAGVDLSQDDGDICATAERAAANVVKVLWSAESEQHALDLIDIECADYGIAAPDFEDDPGAVIARAIDPRWWRRQLRKRIGRAFEAGNIRLGYVSYRREVYTSHDAVLSRLAQNKRNAMALESAVVENEYGHQFTIAELADKSTANKAIRRGELMLRINGFEQVARDNGDKGLFITWTCPSRYHAVHQHNGKPNLKYSGATPREANEYLCKVTALCRSALARRGIGLYGIRIAEPHHDGCPHWHLLLFVRPTAGYKTPHITDVATRAARIMKRYAWRADRGEPGAFKKRLDVVEIDWNIGSAAAYIAKYVSKNIDGVADHKTKEGYSVVTDLAGDVELVPSARVEAWAATWGIRQFQQWGGAPVTIWRELRRIGKDMVKEAPPAMLNAWNAVQKIEGEKRACWASYLRVQGGALVSRKDLVITLAKDEKKIMGRYGERLKITPYGVRCADLIGVVFKSVRHTWTPVQKDKVRADVGGVGFPWTRVNNCTEAAVAGFAADASFAPAPAPAPIKFAAGDAAQIHHAWLALGACPWPRPVMKDAPIGPAPALIPTADDQQRALGSWKAIKACAWPRMAPVPDTTPRRGTPRQVDDWRAGRIDIAELQKDPNPKKGNTP
jgi:hypothetical protein